MADAEPLRILTVLAHPDDESFGPAAMLARYGAAGAQIAGIWFTRGDHGQANMDPVPVPTVLAALREQDLRDAAAVIGYRDLEILSHEDGTLADLPADMLRGTVDAAIARLRPHVVFTFGPAGITRHPDHLAVHRAAVDAFHQAREVGIGVRALYYDAVPPQVAANLGLTDEPDGNPNTFIDVAAFQQVKRAALACHARYIVDAENMLARLDQFPQTYFTMYRAWPPVPDGMRVTELAGQ